MPTKPSRPAKPGKPSAPKPDKTARPDKPADKKTADAPARPPVPVRGRAGRPPKTSEKKAADGKAKTAADKPAAPAMAAKRFINIYLSLGSNLGDRRANLRSALGLIEKNIGKSARKSHLYETQPWGKTDQGPFLNQVVMVNSTLEPRRLLEKISDIERELGRDRREKWGPRTIDIDVLFYGKRVVRDAGLEIPHPELHKRAFVLVPLLEIAPEFEHPIFKQQIDALYMDCDDQSDVVMLEN